MQTVFFTHTPQEKYKRESPTSWLPVLRQAGSVLLLSGHGSPCLGLVRGAGSSSNRWCVPRGGSRGEGGDEQPAGAHRAQTPAVSTRLNLVIRSSHFSHLKWAGSGETWGLGSKSGLWERRDVTVLSSHRRGGRASVEAPSWPGPPLPAQHPGPFYFFCTVKRRAVTAE